MKEKSLSRLQKSDYMNVLCKSEKLGTLCECLELSRTLAIRESLNPEFIDAKLKLQDAQIEYDIALQKVIFSDESDLDRQKMAIRESVKCIDKAYHNGGFIAWYDKNNLENDYYPCVFSISVAASIVRSLRMDYLKSKEVACEIKRKRSSLAERKAAALAALERIEKEEKEIESSNAE